MAENSEYAKYSELLGHCGGVIAPAVSQQFLFFSSQAFLCLAFLSFTRLQITSEDVTAFRALRGNSDAGLPIGEQFTFAAPGARETTVKRKVHMKSPPSNEKPPQIPRHCVRILAAAQLYWFSSS